MRSSYTPSLLTPYFTLGKGKKLFQEQERLIINSTFFKASTQREIIEETKIPQQTISRIVKSLLDRSVLIQTSKESSGERGQPGFWLETNPEFAYGLGLALLMDGISLVLMDFKGQVIVEDRATLADMTVNNVMSHLHNMIPNMLERSKVPQEKILGMGVGISGYFTAQDAYINTHSMLNEWADVKIAELLTEHFSFPVWVENDAKAAAAGEGVDGIGKTYKNFVYLFVSTAFGGGVITDGHIMHGTHGNSGELGDLLPPKRYMHPNLENLRQILIDNNVEITTVAELIEKFDINWPGVNEWVNRVQDAVSLVASASAAILDTQAIVIGGHIPDELCDLLIKNVDIYVQHRRHSSRPTPKLIRGKSIHEPIAVGAASLPLRELCL